MRNMGVIYEKRSKINEVFPVYADKATHIIAGFMEKYVSIVNREKDGTPIEWDRYDVTLANKRESRHNIGEHYVLFTMEQSSTYGVEKPYCLVIKKQVTKKSRLFSVSLYVNHKFKGIIKSDTEIEWFSDGVDVSILLKHLIPVDLFTMKKPAIMSYPDITEFIKIMHSWIKDETLCNTIEKNYIERGIMIYTQRRVKI